MVGEAGTGKTTMVSELLNKPAFVRRLGNVAVTAPTGTVAERLNGTTLHAFAGMTPSSVLMSLEEVVEEAGQRGAFNRIRNCSVLVVDEFFMVHAALLDRVDAICRAARKLDAPFGGLQLVLIGDVMQLPPIAPSMVDDPRDLPPPQLPSVRWPFQSPVWGLLQLHIVRLSVHHRHRNASLPFRRFLANTRVGTLDNDDAVFAETLAGPLTNAVVVVGHRQKAATINEE